jgi:hypothetical protein
MPQFCCPALELPVSKATCLLLAIQRAAGSSPEASAR